MGIIQQSYNREAEKWSSIMIAEQKYSKSQKPLLNLISKYKKTTLLDAGCGVGLYSIFFAKKGLTVVGVDISKNMIAVAKENAKDVKNVKFVCSNMNNFKSIKKFGVVLASSSLHNMKLPVLKKSLKSLVNLLEKNGILAIIMRKGTFEGLKKGQHDIKRYYRYSNPNEIKKLLKDSSLTWEKTYYVSSHKNQYFVILFRNG